MRRSSYGTNKGWGARWFLCTPGFVSLGMVEGASQTGTSVSKPSFLMACGEMQCAELPKSIRARMELRSSQQQASFSRHCNTSGHLCLHTDPKEMRAKFQPQWLFLGCCSLQPQGSWLRGPEGSSCSERGSRDWEKQTLLQSQHQHQTLPKGAVGSAECTFWGMFLLAKPAQI